MPFNDAGAMERRIERLDAEGRKPACVIMEAAMMNLGVVLPEPGYLEAVREITARHGIVLIFDEVKTGLAIAAGGATERFGVSPTWSRSPRRSAAACPPARSAAPRRSCASSRTAPSTRSAPTTATRCRWRPRARASSEVLTPEAYRHLDALNDRIVARLRGVIERHRLPGYAVGVGSKGCVTFSPTKIVDYETFKANQDVELSPSSPGCAT